MQRKLNSPEYRSGNPHSKRAQSDNRSSLAYPTESQSLEPSSFGERTSPPTSSTPMASILAPDGNTGMFYPMGQVNTGPQGYYTNPPPTNPPPMCTLNVPQFSGYYPNADSGLTTDAYNLSIHTLQQLPLETSLDFGGVFPEAVVAHQSPIPPVASEQSIPLSPAFHFHPCRWLGGPPCDGLAPGRNREMAEHLRVSHHFVGHERDSVQCGWEGCGQTIQRMNVPRHIVSRHLLASANCRFCGKRFSRPDVVARHERTCTGISPVSSSPVPRV